jgi:putative endonuclease
MKLPCVYIVTNKANTTLYIGVTSDLIKRIWQHKNGFVAGFTKKYNLHKLVYYEQYEDMYSAICREKGLKKYKREWKLSLIDAMNPFWHDLYYEIIK